MTLRFDLDNVRTTEFGVGRDDGDDRAFSHVVVDADVQAALREMAQATWQALETNDDGPSPYQPSEKHGSVEYLTLPINDDNAASLRVLHQANNLPIDAAALDEPETMFCYFARFTDAQGRVLTAVRRATQFKGVLKNRLIRLVTDALQIIEDKVFKLDSHFDLLIDDNTIHILRPSGFEFVGQLQAAILAAVPQNVQAISTDLSFVEFGPIEEYATRHPRAARYLASIRTQDEFRNIDQDALKRLCESTNVEIRESEGQIVIEDGHVMGFLEVLDRRRYEIGLVRNSPERYRASSRQKLGNATGGQT